MKDIISEIKESVIETDKKIREIAYIRIKTDKNLERVKALFMKEFILDNNDNVILKMQPRCIGLYLKSFEKWHASTFYIDEKSGKFVVLERGDEYLFMQPFSNFMLTLLNQDQPKNNLDI